MSSQILVTDLQFHSSGGYGDVYIGRIVGKGVRVAVKYLRHFKDQRVRKAFLQQVNILGRRRPGLVQLLGSNTIADPPFYIMEYLARGPLSQYAGRLDDTHLHAVAAELAQHLADFHTNIGTHGDVKPANILVTDDGHLKLSDPAGNGVGLSMLFPQNNGGTPGYWAPEIEAGGSMSRPGDVYSYCATLYELLTGRVPQKGQRLDPTAEGYTQAPKIREIIAAGCQVSPRARPTMSEVIRMLKGASWAEIQESRRQTTALFMTVLTAGVMIWALCASAD